MDPQQSGKPQESAPPKRRNKKRGAFRNRVEMLLLRFALGALSRIPERAGLAISAACGSLYSRICIWFGKGATRSPSTT